jgi:hypothetical protein
LQDNLDIIAAKGLIENATFTTTYANASDEISAKGIVEGIIANLSLGGVIAVVDEKSFSVAEEGTPINPNGTDGSFVFEVELTKGNGTPLTTIQLTLTITAKEYDATQDNLDITAAKTAIENATFTTTQSNANSEAAAKEAVEAIIEGLPLGGVDAVVNGVTFNAPTAGTIDNPSGTGGSFAFTVTLNKGGGVQQATIQLTLTITATEAVVIDENNVDTNFGGDVEVKMDADITLIDGDGDSHKIGEDFEQDELTVVVQNVAEYNPEPGNDMSSFFQNIFDFLNRA